jgi:hypothetical protein
MALIRCIECGKSISETAAKCPHCQTDAPIGVNCGICREKDRASSLLAFRAMYRQAKDIQVHRECVESLFSENATCWECGNAIWDGQNWHNGLRRWTLNTKSPNSERLTTEDWPGGHCPHCGANDALANRGLCQACFLPAVKRLHELTNRKDLLYQGDYHVRCARALEQEITAPKKPWWKFS